MKIASMVTTITVMAFIAAACTGGWADAFHDLYSYRITPPSGDIDSRTCH